MRLVKPTTAPREPERAGRQSDDDFLQRLKCKAYEATLEGLEAKQLTVDRISHGMLQEEIGRALEVVLAVEGTTLSITQRGKLIEEVEYEVTGFGPLQPFLDDPSVDDI